MYQGQFKQDVRKKVKLDSALSSSLTVTKHKDFIVQCADKEDTARLNVMKGAPQHEPPEVPKFAHKGQRAKVAKQFRCGHWLYWREMNEDVPQVCLVNYLLRQHERYL